MSAKVVKQSGEVVAEYDDYLPMVRVPAPEARPGDIVDFLGTLHTITSIEPYDPPAFPGEHWSIAHDGTGWGITLEPHTHVLRVVNEGSK